MSSRKFLFIGCVLAIAGCGVDDRPKTVRVAGVVTLDGKEWPATGSLYFLPKEAAPGYPLKPGVGSFGKDGRFVAGTFKSNDGLLPGTYDVRVECWKTAPSVDGPRPISYVAARYITAKTSGITLEVPAGSGPLKVIWDIKSAGGR